MGHVGNLGNPGSALGLQVETPGRGGQKDIRTDDRLSEELGEGE